MYNNLCFCFFVFSLDLNMELPQGQTGSVGTSVASVEQVQKQALNKSHYIPYHTFNCLLNRIFKINYWYNRAMITLLIILL